MAAPPSATFGGGTWITMNDAVALLARFGAEVTKVEPPDNGDVMRHIGPQTRNAPARP